VKRTEAERKEPLSKFNAQSQQARHPTGYYTGPGSDLTANPKKFGKWFADCKEAGGHSPEGLSQYSLGV
jgi:hypothetical protein